MPAELTTALAAAGGVGVALPAAAGADADALLRTTIAALACDALVVVLPAAVGLDPGSAAVWQAVAEAGLPRVALVVGIGPETADFEDLTAIAARVLGAECVPARLPVLDDEEEVTGSLGLVSLVIATAAGEHPAEPEHIALTAELRDALVTEVAVNSADDGFAAGVLAGVTPSPERLGAELAAAVSAGVCAPALAASPDAGWCADLVGWLRPGDAAAEVSTPTGAREGTAAAEGAADPISTAEVAGDPFAGVGTPADPHPRLVLRDAEGQPATGAAGVVLATSPEWLVARAVIGALPVGSASINGACVGADGTAAPARAWPTMLGEPQPEPGGLLRFANPMRAEVGDTVATGHLWLLPGEPF